ncbi:MAG: eIF2A-related protein [Gemmataceae bacterium]
MLILALAGADASAASPPPMAALAYRPDGKQLAAAQGHEVAIIDPATGAVSNRLAGSGRVTALAWSRDGSRFAVATGSPGKAGELRLYDRELTKPQTIPAHADLIQDLAFSPDGKTLATCGYDRLVKLWDTATGKEQRTLKDHSDSVYGVAWRADGKLLASVAADRAVKVWDVATGTRLYTLGDPTDWVYAVAWHPDGRHLAAAGVDKSIRVWDANEKEGRLVRSAFAHEKPVLRLAYSADGKTLFSMSEDRTIKAWDADKLTEIKVFAAQPESVLALAVRPDGQQLALGRYDGVCLLLDTATGKQAAVDFAAIPKPAGTDSPISAPEITLPTTIAGSLSRAGDVDYYHVTLSAGQELGVHAEVPAGSKLEPVLTIQDSTSREWAETTNGLLGFVSPAAGVYTLAVRDREYRGGGEFKYRLHVGDIPIVTAVVPMGLQRGTEAEFQLIGVHLGKDRRVKAKAPADASPGSKIALPVSTSHGKPLGNLNVVVGEFPEVAQVPEMPVPGTMNGRLLVPGASQSWRLAAKKGEPLIVEIDARRLGSPLDSVIEILTEHGKPVERAVLRCLAKTSVTFRDHDSAGSGIRMETWNEFAMDDYVLVGQELMRIRDLPKGPDDDCQFYAVNGQRVGYLGTTPSHHALNTPMFKVGTFPPGTNFPPNGMPVVPVYYRNDDGGPGYGKDSRLRFDPPADGKYRVRIGDARGQGGADFSYRLTVRPPRPDFTVRFSPTAPAVWKGGAVPITVTADRLDDFDGPIQVKLENLPPGFSAPPTFIEAGQTSTTLALFADATAAVDAKQPPLKLIATAQIDGKSRAHEATGGMPKLVEPGDIVTTAAASEVTIHPGQEARLLVRVDRRNGFKGRIPVEVPGLPHGVRVLNIGLNGILVTERDSSREIVIYAEPWVKPTERPFVVLAKREGKNTDHAAKSVLLKVVP